MDVHRVMAIREEMERAEAHRLQPHFIEAFFLEAFKALGGVLRRREEGRWEIVSVPWKVRACGHAGFGASVAARYERVCFDKKYCAVPGQPAADQICPGHPLLEAVIACIRDQHAGTLKRGAVLIDENDPCEDARLLFYSRICCRTAWCWRAARAAWWTGRCNSSNLTQMATPAAPVTRPIWTTARQTK